MDNRALLLGAGIGAVLALAFDPATGRRRRALVRDRVVHGTHVTGRAFGHAAADLANRTRGIVAATRGRVQHDVADDDRLVQRVRARLGRACSHPRAIDVLVSNGHVRLRGPILDDEVKDVVAAAARVRGVRSVTNELESHDSARGVPSLQGGRRPFQPRVAIPSR